MSRGGPLVLRASTKWSKCFRGAQLAAYAGVARRVRLDYIFEPAYGNTLVSGRARALAGFLAALKLLWNGLRGATIP